MKKEFRLQEVICRTRGCGLGDVGYLLSMDEEFLYQSIEGISRDGLRSLRSLVESEVRRIDVVSTGEDFRVVPLLKVVDGSGSVVRYVLGVDRLVGHASERVFVELLSAEMVQIDLFLRRMQSIDSLHGLDWSEWEQLTLRACMDMWGERFAVCYSSEEGGERCPE